MGYVLEDEDDSKDQAYELEAYVLLPWEIGQMVMPSGRAWGETGSKRLDLENFDKTDMV